MQLETECERLTGAPIGPANRIGLAISGGPDSLALLLLAHDAFADHIAVATVDHGLRTEAANEASRVAEICADLGVPHIILKPDQPITGNIQSQARSVRYGLLEKWRSEEDLQWIATAHHADDQLETLLMRLMRGSGIDGLSAIRPINGCIIRPLLGMRKAELEGYVASKGVTPARDPSNEDRAFDRIRLRQLLADFPAFEPARLDRSLAAVREASEALEWVAHNEAARTIEKTVDAILLNRTDYPPELLRRLVLTCLKMLALDITPRGASLDHYIATLRQGEKAVIGDIQGVPEKRDGAQVWRFSAAPPRKTG